MAKQLKIVPDKCTGCMQCELACSWVQRKARPTAGELLVPRLAPSECTRSSPT